MADFLLIIGFVYFLGVVFNFLSVIFYGLKNFITERDKFTLKGDYFLIFILIIMSWVFWILVKIDYDVEF